MKKLLLMLTTFAAAASHAQTYSLATTIRNITVGHGMARVELANKTSGLGEFGACSDKQWFYLDLSATASGSKEMFATLLSAKAANQNVFLQLSGCSDSNIYAKIVHVYVCDTSPTCL